MVRFTPPLHPNAGTITVSDDGHGMPLSVIHEKWMEPATTSKLLNRKSPRGRTMMGSKGIGRFAAAKLGKKMALNSIVETEGTNTEVLIPEIDWDDFTGDRYLSDIEIEYLEQKTQSGTGTLIEIRELHDFWNKQSLSRLLLELRRLISPFGTREEDRDFRIYLDLSDCTKETTTFDGRELVQSAFGTEPEESADPLDAFEVKPYPLLTACDYELAGHFDENGKFQGTFQIRRGDQSPQDIELEISGSDDDPQPGPFDVHFYIFDREAEPLKKNMREAGLGDLSVAEARRILNEVAGVAIYRNSFRVRPYGDEENDWLTLDTRRVQDPSLRIGHNQVAGYITVQDTDKSELVEKSSREGFEDNAAFRRLRELSLALLSRVAEPRRQKFREKAGLSRKRKGSFNDVRREAELGRIRQAVLRLVPPEKQAEAEKIISSEAASLQVQIDQLEERQRVLEAKSSLGAIIGEVLHEGAPRAAYIAGTSPKISGLIENLLADPSRTEVKSDLLGKLKHLRDNASGLADLFRLLRPLAGGKRGKPENFNPHALISSTIEIFETHDPQIQIENTDKVHLVTGYPGDLSTAIINLVGNAIHWLEGSRIEDPRINITLKRASDGVRIFITDNGPGIDEEFHELIFDVGFSLKEGGTGLGLNIAREALARSGAKLLFHPETEEGTIFEIFYPRELK
ncbi:sensor histidine kinase [Roseibium sp.]|uniref:sensor histidine kinase n=1 Tax=Roseibium sp. TaxID=1936156 RepID=UPI003BAF4704